MISKIVETILLGIGTPTPIRTATLIVKRTIPCKMKNVNEDANEEAMSTSFPGCHFSASASSTPRKPSTEDFDSAKVKLLDMVSL